MLVWHLWIGSLSFLAHENLQEGNVKLVRPIIMLPWKRTTTFLLKRFDIRSLFDLAILNNYQPSLQFTLLTNVSCPRGTLEEIISVLGVVLKTQLSLLWLTCDETSKMECNCPDLARPFMVFYFADLSGTGRGKHCVVFILLKVIF